MKFIPLAFTLSLLAPPPTLAQGFPVFCNAGVVSYTGLDTGFACSGQPFSPPPHRNESQRVWVITGENPENVVTVTLDVTPIMAKRPDGNYRHAVCTALPAWTMPIYAEGYPIPEWPLVMVDQSADDNTAGTVTIRVRVLDTLHGLEPNSNYSLNVICTSRL